MPEHNPALRVGDNAPAASRGRVGRLIDEAKGSRLLRNIVTVVGGTAGAQAVTMALMPVITRLYGPEAYGVLGVFLSLVLMTVPLAALTYPMAIVLPRRDADALSLVRLSLLIGAVFAVLSFIALMLWGDRIAWLLDMQQIEPYLWLLPLVMFSAAGLEIVQQWLFRMQRFRLTATTAVIHSVLFNSMRCVAGLINPTVVVLLCTTAMSQAMQALMLVFGIARKRSSRPEDERAAEARDDRRANGGKGVSLRAIAHSHRDFPLYRFPQMLINTVSQNLPTLVLAAHFGPMAAGFFALCKQTLSMPTNLVGKSVADVYYPRMTRAAHAGEPIGPLLLKATGALSLVGLVPFGLVFVAGPWLFAFVFGEQWHVAGEFARWLALAEYMIFVSRPCTVAVPVLDLQGRFLAFEVFSTALRIGALLGGAFLLNASHYTVMAFAGASVLIYLCLILIVLFEAFRWKGHEAR